MAEERDRRRIERELQAEAQRHAQSRHREHAQGVAVGEAENALVAGIDHAVVETRETRGDLLRGFAAGCAVGPDLPVRDGGDDVLTGLSFVLAIVPLGTVLGDLIVR